MRDIDSVRKVANCATRFERYFAQIRPTPFLDDTTTKNVIVHEGKLSGIVDVDWICFGYPFGQPRPNAAGTIGVRRLSDVWLSERKPGGRGGAGSLRDAA